MTVVFLANVGSRDVQVDGMANLPKDSQTLGEMILADFSKYESNLRFPILVKTLEAVILQHEKLDKIILFATDQDDPRYRHTNTHPFAKIIERHLKKKYNGKNEGWFNAALEIVVIHKNPADYDQMMSFYEEALLQIPPSDKVYLAVTGGTPAMSFMLLWQGVQHFGVKAVPLYITQERPAPSALRIGTTLVANAVVDDFKASLNEYEYSAARRILEDNQTLLLGTWSRNKYDAVSALTNYAVQRFNFNFDAAYRSIFGVEALVSSEYAEQFQRLIDEISTRDVAWLLGEEILGVEMDLVRQAYKDAMANIFAFREGFLRQLALKAGAKLTEDHRQLDANWVDQVAGLRGYLESKNIDLTRSVTTFVFEMVLEYLTKQKLISEQFVNLRRNIEKFKKLSDLRNTATHQHGGVSREMVETSFGAPIDTITKDLRALYEQFTDKPVTPYDYRYVNTLITNLIEFNS